MAESIKSILATTKESLLKVYGDFRNCDILTLIGGLITVSGLVINEMDDDEMDELFYDSDESDDKEDDSESTVESAEES